MSKYRRIQFDDDIVMVKHGKETVYKGLEDYEPMKYEPWRWDDKKHCYTLRGGYKKYCLDV